MRHNVRWKQIGNENEFAIKEQVTLPILSMNPGVSGTTRTFMENGKVRGIPVLAEIIQERNGQFVPLGRGKGVLIKDQEGVYLVPHKKCDISFSNADGEQMVEGMKEGVEELAEDIKDEIKDFEPEKQLGFSYKQLLVIAVIGLVTASVIKK